MHLRTMASALLMLLLAASFTPLLAQEESDDEEEAGLGKILVELSYWIAQPRGLDYFPVSVSDPDSPLSTHLQGFDTGTQGEMRTRAGYVFNKNIGAIIGTWYEHDDAYELNGHHPGDFSFGETLAFPYLAGYANDGRADAFEADASTQLSELRIDYHRQAFKSSRVVADWFVGVRRVKYDRSQMATYFALDPDLPPLLPPLTAPRPDLDPNPDVASSSSSYTGRGVEVGLDVVLPVTDRISIESGIAVAAMRSKLDSSYTSLTNAYLLRNPDGSFTILSAPYDEFGELIPNPTPGMPDIPLVDFISQTSFIIGQSNEGISGAGGVIETYLGFRYRAWRSLEAFFGYRNTFYSDVALDLRPGATSFSGTNFEQFTEEKRSVTYEGFYVGASYSF